MSWVLRFLKYRNGRHVRMYRTRNKSSFRRVRWSRLLRPKCGAYKYIPALREVSAWESWSSPFRYREMSYFRAVLPKPCLSLMPKVMHHKWHWRFLLWDIVAIWPKVASIGASVGRYGTYVPIAVISIAKAVFVCLQFVIPCAGFQRFLSGIRTGSHGRVVIVYTLVPI